MKQLSCCFFPTQVVFVDDNMTFLESLSLELDVRDKSCIFYDDPDKALNYIKEASARESFVNRIVQQQKSYELQKSNISISLDKIYKEIYNPSRYELLSVVVVDYDMPQMNGLSLCAKIQSPHIKKILLTGAADEHIAINAFNEGLIDHYIPKGTKNLAEVLDKAIRHAQKTFFFELSEIIIGAIKGIQEQITALTDPIFVHFFEEFIKKHQIREYYLFEGVGSFLLVDYQNQFTNLFVKTEEQMKSFYWEAKDEEDLPNTVKDELRDFKKMVCFYIQDNEPIPPPTEWLPYLNTAHSIPGAYTRYYWAHTPNILNLKDGKVAMHFS